MKLYIIRLALFTLWLYTCLNAFVVANIDFYLEYDPFFSIDLIIYLLYDLDFNYDNNYDNLFEFYIIRLSKCLFILVI